MAATSWEDNWNSIIRFVLFQDEELKKLMRLPQKTSILDFRDKYFIRAGYTNRTLTNEDVRIIYGHINTGSDSNAESVSSMKLSFDIYVKNEHLYNATADRLQMRTDLIAARIKFLLKKNRYIYGYRFFNPKMSDMGTGTIGYSRLNLTFSYIRTE